jgi:ankyrin repeat protein
VSELQVATRYGLSTIARSIIDSLPDQVTYQDDFGTSAWHEAAQGGWADIIDMLLKAGALSSLMNEEERPPLYYAAQNGNTEIISMISEAKHTNEIHPQRSDPPIPPSEQIQRSGRIETAPFNQDHGSSLALEEAFCETAGAGRLDVTERLLREYANPNMEKDGKPAIIYAIQGEHELILHLLLDAGARRS